MNGEKSIHHTDEATPDIIMDYNDKGKMTIGVQDSGTKLRKSISFSVTNKKVETILSC